MNEETLNGQEVEFKPVSPEVLAATSKVLADIRSKSYSARHPELGKMIKCQVCGQRHRNSQKCIQTFTTKWFEEDMETGVVETIFATAAPQGQKPTKRQIMGSAAFKAKRIKRRLSPKDLQLVERTKQIFNQLGFGEDTPPAIFQKYLKVAREAAELQLRAERKKKAKKYRRQQEISRRINHGSATPGRR